MMPLRRAVTPPSTFEKEATRQYLDGPWLLYDSMVDPYQMNNLVGNRDYADIQAGLESRLQRLLAERGDEFHKGLTYLERDGLAHYREVNSQPSRIWEDPWRNQ